MGGNVSRFFCPEGAITAVSMRLWRTKRNCFAPVMTFCEDWMCGHLWGIVRIYTIFSSSTSGEFFPQVTLETPRCRERKWRFLLTSSNNFSLS